MRNGMKRFFAGTLAMMMLFAMTGCRSKAQTLGTEEKEAMAPIETTTPIEHIDIKTDGEALAGGWFASDDIALPEEVKEAYDKAMEGLVGVDYEPVAFLESQVVAGMNYRILCKSTVVYPGAETGYVIVTVYRALDGSAEVTDIADVALGVRAEK